MDEQRDIIIDEEVDNNLKKNEDEATADTAEEQGISIKQPNSPKDAKPAKKSKALDKNIIALAIEGLLALTLVLYLSLGWQKEVKLTSSFLNGIILSLFVVATARLVQKAIMFFLENSFKSQKAKTITTLLRSLTKYAISIVVVIIILIIFLGEAYMTELFAGLGVVGLIVGLGCQTLINDIVAGIFMVFEGNYHVGDVVVLNNWRGTVVEIGVRTTVIEDVGGNKKIINNSSISEIVNNSKTLSVATCTLGIEYDEDLARVEKIIEANCDRIRQNNPNIVTGPTYRGISELGASSINLLIVCTCKEEDKYQVQRDLNREYKLIFDKNNINFPYPQTTISARKEPISLKIDGNNKK